jgi:hypothetical protein
MSNMVVTIVAFFRLPRIVFPPIASVATALHSDS